ncbi:hypothetical protein [Brachybacterium tyrofermentans]|uniref:hypothetical protein n=1 Tax=Brachybacterium tyrofermentans TaxID=47848 RepID=UPI001867F2DF|nr:hypothetical protein [Brachybacterium tyrofermentans]
MARRTVSNVRGDIGELEATKVLLEHGVAINSLTQSDTGWDLHCHVPEDIIRNASGRKGNESWIMSGRAAHFQVKSGGKGELDVETVGGWLTGARIGVPTFMFWSDDDRSVISTPNELEAWLETAISKTRERIEAEVFSDVDDKIAALVDEDLAGSSPTVEELAELKAKMRRELTEKKAAEADGRKFNFVAHGSTTLKQAELKYYRYSVNTFPSILQFWVRYPVLALDFPQVTEWLARECDGERANPLMTLAIEFANTIWSQEGFGYHTDQDKLVRDLEGLFRDAGAQEPMEDATAYLGSSDHFDRLAGDRLYTRDSVPHAVSASLDNRSPRDSARCILAYLDRLYRESRKAS